MEAETLQPHAKTLLIVDDEPMLTSLFARSLSKRGYRVLEASNGEDAAEFAQQERASIALVITDMTMPDMDGVALAALLFVLLPEVPVLIATGHDVDQYQLGATPNLVGLIRKPFQYRAVADQIDALLKPEPAAAHG